MDKNRIEIGDALKIENGEVSLVNTKSNSYLQNIVVGFVSTDPNKSYPQLVSRATSPNYQQIPACCEMYELGYTCKHKVMEELRAGTKQKYSMGSIVDISMENKDAKFFTISIPKSRPARNDPDSINQLFKFVTVDNFFDIDKNLRQTSFKSKKTFGEKQMHKLVFHYVVGEPYTARQVKSYTRDSKFITYSKTTVKGGVTTDSTHKVSLEDVGVLEMHCGDTRTIWKNPAYEKKFSIKVEKSVLSKTPKTSQKEKKVNPRKRKTEVTKPVAKKVK